MRLAALLAALVLLAACGGSSDATVTVMAPPSIDATQHCAARGPLPDPVCTPGVANPNVTQANIQTTICKSGWTATVRPPVSYTTPLKVAQMKQYGLTGPTSDYEEDHFIPLELGGSPTDPLNLWPEAAAPVPGFHQKDQVENQLKALVCAGKMTLADAQQRIVTDWRKAVP